MSMAADEVWEVQAGCDGQWRSVGSPTRERHNALQQLEWFRAHAPHTISHRLVRETTTVTFTIEDA